ncbi:EscF/YscF/HrpA family type III secretion system needle major subunit [Yersinia ruckeri]|uniref:EscF/YscF/HrpA family type III secretion system needle major subunit n=1 Tax=Yersinia ruckeri TaxID=29486 RepID=UPI0020C13947|nr:EscF/YscF/HrpA family type III secretion system needle major subunit [Yersinia ruckeri]MCW6540656.1 EscF/YscF/HrpA family type III secretion system needle major subunit [Yersinia ruckeri]MCW6637045.1 EscF/YscF/HrpA family type III secretion system needle major subunit [Yersinia ruckeri]UZX64579.1 EscF/YscF/HrpA family type III secretion system needle major subunit [Yersinia ruckeri]UZX67865.1 EscF/YscF/HrpA family type III secretion system needle major subunit [Yersinia ruckeri]UZY10812.1 E
MALAPIKHPFKSWKASNYENPKATGVGNNFLLDKANIFHDPVVGKMDALAKAEKEMADNPTDPVAIVKFTQLSAEYNALRNIQSNTAKNLKDLVMTLIRNT